MTDPEEQVAQRQYGPGAVDEVIVPPNDPVNEPRRQDVDEVADVAVDPDDLRDGGPTHTRGMVTTTGGKAGPASVHRRARQPDGPAGDHEDEAPHEGKVAPTTTGAATSGGMSTPAGGSTSDEASGAGQIGGFTER
jgi:hypothetical protein